MNREAAMGFANIGWDSWASTGFFYLPDLPRPRIWPIEQLFYGLFFKETSHEREGVF